MSTSQTYIAISILILLLIALVIFFVGRRGKRKTGLSPLAGLAFGFILAGILFGEEQILGYGLLGLGVLLAVIDIIVHRKDRTGQ